jgi:lipopolysaccharide/colanic/teichoic acid biosynthesis glycosyltransferase
MELNLQKTTTATDSGVLHFQVASKKSSRFQEIAQSVASKKFDFFLKRSFDITVASILIILFAPILIAVALIIKFTSRGPILYSNERVGLDGINFKCHKFRSMVNDQTKKKADHKRHIEDAQKGILHKDKNDTRITWIGKIIRKTSIDELPQLFNVLFGDMSIVGPRPLVPFMLAPYPEFKEIRCLVRPGITGLWQIRDREHNTSAEFMIEHDTEYIVNYSFSFDMKILIETPLVVLSGKGAY